MRILYISGRETNYTRNDVLVRALHRIGKVKVISGENSGSLILRSVLVFIRALPHIFSGNYDLIFVGFYGHILMLPVKLLSRRPLIFDAFVSTYDTLCFDRGIFAPDSMVGKFAYWLDRTSSKAADRVLVDTRYQRNYFIRTFDLNPDMVKNIPVGCNEDIFNPRPEMPEKDFKTVLFYCTYLPLHGVDIVVRAASLLRSENELKFRLIGSGMLFDHVHKLADNMGLGNITFIPYIPIGDLPAEINRADICLGGHFGKSEKAGRVIPGKVFQILAMARPLIAADTRANRDLLSHKNTAYLCSPDDPEALASAIKKLSKDDNLRVRLANRGCSRFLEQASERIITERLSKIVHGLD